MISTNLFNRLSKVIYPSVSSVVCRIQTPVLQKPCLSTCCFQTVPAIESARPQSLRPNFVNCMQIRSFEATGVSDTYECCGKKKEDPCKKKEDPCKKKEDPCKKKEKKEDPCKKKDACKKDKKEDPCKKKNDACKKKEDPCKKNDKKKDACKKEDACKKKEDPCKKKEDPCKKKTVKLETLMDLKCKVAIVTGGYQGIGFETTYELLCQEAKHVIMAGNDCAAGEEAVQKLCEEFGDGKASFVELDVTDDKQFKDVFEDAMNEHEQIDILVNNSGVLNDKEWENQNCININGVIRGSLLGFKYMGKDQCGKGGVIVNIAAQLGLQEIAGIPMYVGSKHAVVGFTRSLGDNFHFCRNDVRVITMCPSVTTTPFWNNFLERQYDPEWAKQAEEQLDCMPKQCPEAVGKGIAFVIKHGPTASVWVVEGNEIFLLDIPERQSYSKKIASLK